MSCRLRGIIDVPVCFEHPVGMDSCLIQRCLVSFSLAACLAPVTLQASAPAAVDTVALPGFRIDRSEVTVARFEAFLQASARQSTAEREGGGYEWGAGWDRRQGWPYHALSG